MPLADDLQDLQRRVSADLASSHDYFEDTRHACTLVEQLTAEGRTFRLQNFATGTITTEAELARKAKRYVAEQLMEMTFLQFLAVFESFLVDLIRHWLVAFPQNLGNKTLEFREVLKALDIGSLTIEVVHRELSGLMYLRPREWFEDLNRKVNLGCPSSDEIEQFAEAKASRDVIVHNRRIVNRTYLLKAGSLARHAEGERIEIPEDYHRRTWDLLRKLAVDLFAAAVARAV